MEITDKTLAKFKVWLLERGRVEGTAETYIVNLRSCAADSKGLTHRLVAGDLSPNSLRTNLAALRSWAMFTGDAALTKRLADIRLPPARGIHTKQPLSTPNLRDIIRHLQTCPIELRRSGTTDASVASMAMRQVILIMAMRGFRSGDVLRIKRTEIIRALDTGKLIYEGKGRKRLEFSISPFRAPLERLVEVKGWDRVRDLISTSENPRVASVKVWRAARRTAQQIGIPEMNPHRYRHTFATRYLERLQGDPAAIIKLQQYMGWESMNTAARYVSAVSQDELDRIGAGLINGLLE